MEKLFTVIVMPPLEGKLDEVLGALKELPVELVSFEMLSKALPPGASAGTLAELAAERAQAGARLTLTLTLGEAYGLEVDALGGAPGVRSAVFAHEHATDAENNAALLRALGDERGCSRSARLCAVFALANPWDGTVQFARGVCEGDVTRTAAGAGYGYGALFAVRELRGQCMTELSEPERAAVSPRQRALRELNTIVANMVLLEFGKLRELLGGEAARAKPSGTP